MNNSNSIPRFPALLQQFFAERLIQQKNASPQTIASYRDTFRLFLSFAQQQLHKSPAKLELTDLDTQLVLAFLNHIERKRHNSIRTRNARLTAIRSFFHYAALRDPLSLSTIHGVLAIPMKRFEQPLMDFYSREEMNAILNAPDPTAWCGQRDRVMLATLYNTGVRVSELIGMTVEDLVLERSSSVRIHGKGRKERTVPLWHRTATQLRRWLREIDAAPDQHLFPNRSGGAMSRTGVTDRLKLAARAATESCPQLRQRKISPHRIRHSTACHLLQSGVDLTVIALWLGHENPATTHIYVEADLEMKQRALNTLNEPNQKSNRYKPTESIMKFLEGL